MADAIIDTTKDIAHIKLPRPHVLQQIAKCCRKGGTLSIPGVYIGFVNMVPFGAVMNKALTIKTGQTHTQRYLRPLLQRIKNGDIDPSFVVTHRLKLADAPHGFAAFNRKEDGCIKIVMQP